MQRGSVTAIHDRFLTLVYLHLRSGAIGNILDANTLLGYQQWMDFIRDLHILDPVFSRREGCM